MLRGRQSAEQIQGDLLHAKCGYRCHAVRPRVNPLRTSAEHKFHFFGERPRLFEQKVRIPLCRVTGEQRGGARLKLQPILDRCHLNCEVGAEARSGVFEIPGGRSTQLYDCCRLLIDKRMGIATVLKEAE